ncbi:hypothetical protein DHX103_11050 [Planococcus sp. X10-3]|uniref:hypothetical protein n=1 Tax=Planococcus sp. X10-3 TaxID=3061240 RepID=UPI003BAFD562
MPCKLDKVISEVDIMGIYNIKSAALHLEKGLIEAVKCEELNIKCICKSSIQMNEAIIAEVADKLLKNFKSTKTNSVKVNEQSDEERTYIEIYRLVRLIKE